MKLVKLSIFALAMGLFVASCGNSETTEGTETVDTAMTVPEAAPAPVDTMMAAPATDSAAAATTAPAPAEAAH